MGSIENAFEGKIDARYLQSILEPYCEIKKEGVLRIDEHGFKIRDMDDTHVCMVDVLLAKKLFTKYSLKSEIVKKVKFDILYKVLRPHSAEVGVELFINMEADTLSLVLHDEASASDRTVSAKLFLMDDESVGGQTEVPQTSAYPDYVLMLAKRLQKTCLGLSDCFGCAQVKILAGPNAIEFSGDGPEGSGNVIFEHNVPEIERRNLEDICQIDVSSHYEQKIALRYLSLVGKAGGIHPHVSLHFEKDQPLGVTFLVDGDSDAGYFTFFIPPVTGI